jgi:hypothetical protein
MANILFNLLGTGLDLGGGRPGFDKHGARLGRSSDDNLEAATGKCDASDRQTAGLDRLDGGDHVPLPKVRSVARHL